MSAPSDETAYQKLLRKSLKDPVVPLGVLVTTGVLVAGLRAFNRGDKQRSQQLMRYRVLAQGLTVVGMMVGVVAGLGSSGRRTA
jgi:hypothetical protein